MAPPRVIPCLLLGPEGLVKTVRFGRPRYVGDAANAVRVFNEKEVDELLFLDIHACAAKEGPRLGKVRQIAGECFMPLCYGGGVRNIADMKALYESGVEKIALNTAAVENPELVREAAERFGSQSVVVCVDVRRDFWGRSRVTSRRGRKFWKWGPADFAARMEACGAGEILIQSVDRDGVRRGYDISLIREVSAAVKVPVIALGGAGGLEDFRLAEQAGASAMAAGSLFVFHGKHRAVLITYPEPGELGALFGAAK